MATTYGLTLSGLVIKFFAQIRSEIDDAVRGTLGPVPLGDRTLLGEYNAIWSDREASLWQLLEVVYSSGDPDKATGGALDALCLLTGTLRPQASSSSATLLLGGVPGTLIPSGSQVRTASTQLVFGTTSSATLTLATLWATGSVYVIGDVRYRVIAGTNTLFQCILGLTSTVAPESDAAHWIQIGTGTAWASIGALSLNTGAIEAPAGFITQIVTAVSGWQTVFNQLDAAKGRDIATDEELRLLRESELSSPGTAPVDAIRADLLEISGVTTCTVYDNPTDVTNTDGMPPHSVEALLQTTWDPTVTPAADQVIFDRLLTSVAGGIGTTGGTTGASVDTQGISHVMKFSRPSPLQIYATVALIKDARYYPLDGDAQVAVAIASRGNTGGAGKDAVAASVIAACFTVSGVLDVTTAFIGTAPGPATSTTISVDTRHIAVWDSGPTRIIVTSTNGIP